MKAGPKVAVDPRVLPFRPRSTGAARFAKFCEQFMTVPKGKGARRPLRLRPWQIELVGSVLDPDPRPRIAGWMLPRGQGKTTLVAALGLYDLLLGAEGASVVVAATDERQAGLCFRTAARMVELNEDLAARVQVYQDRLAVPARGAWFHVLPAVPKRLEGLDPTLAILDEVGVIDREVYEVVSLASGKRESSLVLGIGTPGPDPDNSVLLDMRTYAGEHPDDASFVWREFSAAGFEDHPVDCEHCWEISNPALNDFLHRDAMHALLPPKMREATFRRARLCQFAHGLDDPWLPPGSWEACTDLRSISDGTPVVIALDGSFSQDCTAVVAVSIEDVPHIEVVACWEPPVDNPDYRVPVVDVEQAIRDACRKYQVREIVCDPFRWTRSMQALESEGLPMIEYPQSPQRMTPATTGLYEAVVNGQVTHSGDARLARHVGNAVVKEDARGTRLAKSHKHSTRRIDLAVAAVMAHARVCELGATAEPMIYLL
jgi:phage terminase large subunit-like protein